MMGLNYKSFKDTLEDARFRYKKILTEISKGEDIDIQNLLYFKGFIVDLLVMQNLNETELKERDIYVDKFFSLLDVIEALFQIKKTKKSKEQ